MDPHHDAVALWAGVHDLASLPPANPRFPWPELDGLVDAWIDRLLGIDDGEAAREPHSP